MKILILGSSARSDWLEKSMLDMGYEVHRMTGEEMKIQGLGSNPDLIIADEKYNADFSSLELHYLGHRGSSKTQMNCDLLMTYKPTTPDKRKEPKGPRTRWGELK